MFDDPHPRNGPVKHLAAVWDRVYRASEHIEAVKDMTTAYFNSDAYHFEGEYDPDTPRLQIWHRALEPPPRLNTLVGEIAHNLRSSLDHLVWALVRENGGTPDDETYWPVPKAPRDAPKRGPSRGVIPPPVISGGVSAEASALIARHQPFRVPDGKLDERDEIWMLHRLSVVDKHRHVPLKGVLLDHLTFGSGSELPAFAWTVELVRADAYSAEVRIVPDDFEVPVQGDAVVHLVLCEPEWEPSLVTTLEGLRDRVTTIVTEAEATCFST